MSNLTSLFQHITGGKTSPFVHVHGDPVSLLTDWLRHANSTNRALPPITITGPSASGKTLLLSILSGTFYMRGVLFKAKQYHEVMEVNNTRFLFIDEVQDLEQSKAIIDTTERVHSGRHLVLTSQSGLHQDNVLHFNPITINQALVASIIGVGATQLSDELARAIIRYQPGHTIQDLWSYASTAG